MNSSLKVKTNQRLMLIWAAVLVGFLYGGMKGPWGLIAFSAVAGAAAGWLQLAAMRQSTAELLRSESIMDVRRAIRTTSPGKRYILAFWITQVVIIVAAVTVSGSRFWAPWLVGYCVFALARETVTLRGCAELERAYANLAEQH